MTRGKRKNNIISIAFNKDFYNLRAIKKAIQAYQGLADFEISQNKKAITVELKETKPEVKKNIRDEFSNYVLALMKQ